MRVMECDCGEVVQAANDDDLLGEVKRHVADAHPDMEASDDELRSMIASKAYDATDS